MSKTYRRERTRPRIKHSRRGSKTPLQNYGIDDYDEYDSIVDEWEDSYQNNLVSYSGERVRIKKRSSK